MSTNLTMKKRIVIVALIVSLCFALMPLTGETVHAASKKAKKPAVVATTALKLQNDTKLTYTWSKAKNAKKYQVYQKIGKGKWKKVKTTKARSFKITGKYSTKYTFKVRGVNGKKVGKFSKTISMTTYKKPVKTTTPAKNGGGTSGSDVIKPLGGQDGGSSTGGSTGGNTGGNSGNTGGTTDVTKTSSITNGTVGYVKSMEFTKSDGTKVTLPAAKITVDVKNGNDNKLIWYYAESTTSYENAEFALESDKASKNIATATFYTSLRSKPQYVFCSIKQADGSEVRSQIFTIKAAE